MMKMPKLPESALKWTIQRAAREFRVSHNTVKDALTETHQQPDEEGTFTTIQIVNALYSDLRTLRAKEIEARTLNWTLRNESARGALLDKKAVENALAAAAQAIIGVLKGSNLSRRDREDVMKELETALRAVEAQAKKQQREFGLNERKSEAQEPGEENE